MSLATGNEVERGGRVKIGWERGAPKWTACSCLHGEQIAVRVPFAPLLLPFLFTFPTPPLIDGLGGTSCVPLLLVLLQVFGTQRRPVLFLLRASG